jgi:hypothetical protein
MRGTDGQIEDKLPKLNDIVRTRHKEGKPDPIRTEGIQNHRQCQSKDGGHIHTKNKEDNGVERMMQVNVKSSTRREKKCEKLKNTNVKIVEPTFLIG